MLYEDKPLGIRVLFSAQYKESILNENATLHTCLKCINRSFLIVCIVSSRTNKLCGIITDSDIRKALLNGASLDDTAGKWMNRNPVVGHAHSTRQELFFLSKSRNKTEIPIVNSRMELIDIFVCDAQENSNSSPGTNLFHFNASPIINAVDNPVFILAGGLGSRLRPIVNDRPKPLALVAGKPIIEILINNLAKQGLINFFVSVNYLAEQIESFLKLETFSHLNIELVHEKKRLGTAGSLGIIKNKIEKPILICNADVITNVNFKNILLHHKETEADITCVVRPFQFIVPYGVVQIEQEQISAMVEKPKYNFLINAGIYVLSPDICKFIHENEYLDMPEFISNCILMNKRVIPYLLHEYWIDVGYPEDYTRANDEFHLHFEG